MLAWAEYHDKSSEPAADDPFTPFWEWPLPWHLPRHFAQTIRDVINGASAVRFPGTDAALWDAQACFEARKDWEEWDW